MNEIITIKETNFKNATLTQATIEINELGTEVMKNFRNIARILADVASNECYKEDGFKNCAEYAMKTFGFKQSFSYNLIAIGKRFSEANTALADYSATQLIKMLPMSDEEIENALESGEINADMTAKEIEVAVKMSRPAKTKNRKVKKYRFVNMFEDGTIIDTEENFILRTCSDFNHAKVKVGERTLYVAIDAEMVSVWERIEEIKETEEKENN